MDFRDRQVAIVGFGAEGRAAAEFLLERGAKITVCDVKPEGDFVPEDIAMFRKNGVAFRFGPGGSFDEFDIIVRSPGVPPHIPALLAAKEKGVTITSGTQLFFDECPAPIIGVTGTKGKGTTSALLHAILKIAKKDSYLLGNIGEPALHALPALNPSSIVVYELSSFQLMDVRTSPHIAIALMVTRDHLDFHADEEEYAAAKGNIAKFQTPQDIVIANADYARSRHIAGLSPGRKYWLSRLHSVEEGCAIVGDTLTIMADGAKETICHVEEIALHGSHNLENACAAAMAAYLLGASREDIREGLRSFKGLPHRLQLVGEAEGVRYYDDSIATTPESALAAIKAFENPKIVILGGSSKGADFKELAEEIAANGSIKAIMGIGEEWARMRAHIFNSQFPISNGPTVVEGFTTMAEVVAKAAEIAEPGDVVLLAPGCASFGMFRDYKDRGEQFINAVRSL